MPRSVLRRRCSCTPPSPVLSAVLGVGGIPWGLTGHSSLVAPSFWDWEKGEKLDYFHNGNPRYTRVTAMEYLNGQDCSLLLTATGEWVAPGPVQSRTES